MEDSSFIVEVILRAIDEASGPIRNLNRAVDDLKAKAESKKAVDDLGDSMEDLGKDARGAESDLRSHREETGRSAQAHRGLASDLDRARQSVSAHRQGVDDHTDSMSENEKQARKMSDAYKEFKGEADNMPFADQRRGFQQMGSDMQSLTRNLEVGSDAWKEMGRSADEAKKLASTAQMRQDADDLKRSYSDMTSEIRAGTVSFSSAKDGMKDFARQADGLRDSFGRTTTEGREMGQMVDEITRKVSKLVEGAEKQAIPGGFLSNLRAGDASNALNSLSQSFDNVGLKIVSLSAELRGLRLVSIVGLAQQLDTGLLSLAGSFFSVASGAAQAAATIGGVFLSGVSQMVPIVSIGVAALMRLKDVFQAVSASQQEQQQAFFQPNQGLITQLQNTSQLITAEQNLANAYYTLNDAQVQVKESQMELTQARIDAIRNITNLTIAEKQAQLELKGANLSLTQAEQQERAAQASGDQESIQESQLAVQQAQLARTQAQIGVPRSQQDLALAVSYGIAGSPEVLSATEAAKQAVLGVKQAQQQIADMQREIEVTRLTLAQPASQESQQQATVQYLEKQMSGPELALFKMLDDLETQLRSPDSPLKKITDYFIQPFLDMATRLNTLLHDKRFIQPIDDLAKAMGGELGTIENIFFGKKGTSFFEGMAEDATKNVPIITKAILGLLGVIRDISTAAAPAFTRLSEDWAKFWSSMNARDSSDAGQTRLTEFFNKGAVWAEDFAHLARSIVDLFMALGHDAAPQGMDTVTTFSETIQRATKWVDDHGPEVTKFFAEANQGLSAIGSILLQIGKEMVQAFSLTSLQALSQLMIVVVLPALRDVVTVIGFVVTKFVQLLDAVGPLKDIIVALVAGFMGLLVISRVISLFSRATLVVGGLKDAYVAWKTAADDAGFFSRVGAAWDALTSRITGATRATNDMAAAQKAAVADADADAAAQDAAATGEGAAGTAAVVAAPEVASLGAMELTAGGGSILAAGGGAGVAAGAAGIGAEEAGVGALSLGGGAAALGVGGVAATIAAPIAALVLALETGGPTRGTQTGGLGSLLGPVGGTHDTGFQASSLLPENWFGGSGFAGLGAPTAGNQSASTTSALRSLQDGLKGISSPLQLSSTQLQTMYEKALKIEQMPDITAKQRNGLSQLIDQLNPATVATSKFAATWDAAFSGISSTTGSVFTQVKQTVAQNLQLISTNLGDGTKQGAQALMDTFATAVTTIDDNTSTAAQHTKSAMKTINDTLNSALKAMGEPAIDFFGTSRSPGAGGGSLSNLKAESAAARASGGWNPATSGGMLYRAGEAGHDEVTLSTDPRHAPRTSALLGQFIRRMASGGIVGQVDQFFSKRGWDKVAIAGMLGNALQESSLDPNTPGGGMWQQISNFGSGTGGSLLNQMETMLPQIASLRRSMNTASSPGEAATIFMNEFERPKVATENLARRILGANEAYSGTLGADLTSSVSGSTAMSKGGAQAVIGDLISAPKVQGVSGAIGQIANATVKSVASAANTYLSSLGQITGTGFSGSSGGSGGSSSPSIPFTGATLSGLGYGNASYNPLHKPIANWIIPILNWARAHGFDGTVTSGYRSFAEQEYLYQHRGTDGISSIVALPGTSNHEKIDYPGGAVDVDGGSDQRLISMLRDYHGHPTLIGGNLGPADPYHFSATGFAAGGLLTKHLRRMGLRDLRKKILRFAEGGVAPWGGKPVMIEAHEGERISNPPQWEHVASMAGMTGSQLDSHMGYDTGSPRQRFLTGGIAGPTQVVTSNASSGSSLTSLNSLLGNLTPGLNMGSLTSSLSGLAEIMKAITSALSGLTGATLKTQISKLSTIIENLADPNNQDSALNLLSTAFQLFTNNINAWLTKYGYKSTAVSPASIANPAGGGTITGAGFGGVSLTGPALTAGNIGQTGQPALDALTTRSSVEETTYLQDQSDAVQKVIDKTKSKMTSVRHSSMSAKGKNADLDKLQALLTELETQQSTLNSSIASQISTTFQDEQTYVQDILNQVSDVYQTQQQQIQASQSSAQSLGQYGALPGIDAALAGSAQAQITALGPALAAAQKINDPDLVAQIEQQISQLQTTVVQAIAQMIQDAISAVEQAAQTSQADVSMKQTIASTMLSSTSSTAGFQQAGALNLAALNENQTSMQSQLQAYNALLPQAMATGNQGAVATLTQNIDQLTAQLYQNYQAIQDNTAQIVNQTAQFIQGRGQFQTGVYSGLSQVINTIGQTTGFTNVPALQQLTTASNTSLQSTNTGLLGQLSQLGGGATGLAGSLDAATTPQQFVAALSGANTSSIESGQSQTWITTFETLINNLTQNTEAIATNNQQLATLNGQLLQPQSWSTTAWASFRNAIFSGMGNLLPQYQSSLPAGSQPTIAPVFGSAPITGQTPTIGTLNLTHPVETLDPSILGQQLHQELVTSV
jgi:Phage tail lysozyme/D-alanyl-D-alanine carboxypeptidase